MAEVLTLTYSSEVEEDLNHTKLSYTNHAQYVKFADLISNLFIRGNNESDTNHPLVIVLDDDNSNISSSSTCEPRALDLLTFEDKVLLLKYFFNHLNLIIIDGKDLVDDVIVEQLNLAIKKINLLINNRISRVETWTGTGSSSINDFFAKNHSPASLDHHNTHHTTSEATDFAINKIISTMSFTLNNSTNKSVVSINHIIHLKDRIMEETDFLSLLSNHSPQHLSTLCHLVGHWSFPAHELSNDDLVYCVYLMINYALRQIEGSHKHVDDNCKKIHIPSSNELLGLVFMVRDSYKNGNPFHNFRHAVDVLQACFHFLIRLNCLPVFKQLEVNPNADELNYLNTKHEYDGLLELVPLIGAVNSSSRNESSKTQSQLHSPTHLNHLQTLGLLVAALGHDVGHPGVTNAFMIKYSSPTSLIYNERSVLESFHSSVFINKILVINWPSLLAVFTEGKAQSELSLKEIISSSILATDMAEHFEYIHKLNVLKKEDFTHDKGKVKLICSLLIKCADISNVTRPLRVSSQWAMVLAREFEEVAMLERKITNTTTNLNLSKELEYQHVPVHLEDVLKSNPVLHKGQIFFNNTFAENLFNNISEFLPELKFTCNIIKENKKFWLARDT